uniref:Activator of Hsp90 ATPase AHSA1-like N-terminal domain-containing protein n=1 Tax=Spumella elongata TaxID=89044 RepID=A0A7S3GS10_9STRA|mmetsp:Transcript_15799/g.27777  ORF Transcript_15799/g.27777 Transcript_15799/m.27777 type:complete len:202 (+) Transcript_15799:56-661(+)
MEEVKESKESKGVKLPYFHRTLSPEEMALIGDITPKAITVTADATATGKIASGSAWNSAQTWEERDCTKWAMEKLPTLFENKEDLAKANQFIVQIKRLSNSQGSAQIAHVRGKARFIYELSFDLEFSVTDEKTSKKYKGKVAVSDVINDQLDDIEFALSWTGASPPNAELSTVRNAVIGGNALKKLIRTKIAIFEEDFRKL